MRRLMRRIALSILTVAVCFIGPAACRRNATNNDNSLQQQQQNPQQKGQQSAAEGLASGEGGGPVPEPAQSTTGSPSEASDAGSSTATKDLPSAQPGAPVGTEPETSASGQQTSGPRLMVPAGTTLSIRLNQKVGVQTSREGDLFTARVISPLETEERTTIPAGASVAGVVLRIRRREPRQGISVLTLMLSGLNVKDRHYQLRTPGSMNGDTSLATLVEGIGDESTGHVYGSLSGTKAGTITANLTGARNVDYPADALLSFHLNSPLVLQP